MVARHRSGGARRSPTSARASQQQADEGRARVLVPDRALAEIRRAALRREHRDRWPVAPASAAAAIAAVTAAESPAAATASRPAATAGTSASSIVFSPVVALPSDSIPPIAGLEGIDQDLARWVPGSAARRRRRPA